jgi:hypothetical protein
VKRISHEKVSSGSILMALQKISKGPWGKNIELQMSFKSVQFILCSVPLNFVIVKKFGYMISHEKYVP